MAIENVEGGSVPKTNLEGRGTTEMKIREGSVVGEEVTWLVAIRQGEK